MPDSFDFPMNIVNELISHFKDTMKGYEEGIVARPLRPADPRLSIGVFPDDWMPREDSYEIGGFGPTLSTYVLRIHLLVKHTNEVEGRQLYAVDAKKLRAILYRDNDLRLRLAQLSEVSLGQVERVQRMGVRNQRYLNNEVSGTFLFLATTTFWVETETQPV